MRFAAAALMAGLVFLVGAIAGFGGSAPTPSDFPQAIRLSGVGIQAPTELPTTTPDTGTLPAAAGSPVPAVAVGHTIVPVPLMPAASPTTARRQPTPTTSGPTSNPATSTEPVAGPGITLTPLQPVLTTTFSPVPPTPAPAPTPRPTATPTPTPTPTLPQGTPTPTPSSAKRGLLRSLLGLP